VDGRIPNILEAISLYKNPSRGTLHFLHFLDTTPPFVAILTYSEADIKKNGKWKFVKDNFR